LRDGASSANLSSRDEHGVEDVVAFFDFVIIIVIVIQVWEEIWQVTIVSFQFVPLGRGPRPTSANLWARPSQ
jgi:hypothetical protein